MHNSFRIRVGKLRGAHGLAAAVVALLVIWLNAAPIAAQSYSGYYDDDDDFDVELSGMPDFDQIRAQDEPDTNGLPGDGEQYCSPTKTMNSFAFLANNGWPELLPGPGDWDDERDMEAYWAITEHIEDLGSMMDTTAEGDHAGTYADGTTDLPTGDYYAGWFNGAKEWIAASPYESGFNRLVVELYMWSGYDTTTARAAYHATRGSVGLCYGRYDGSYSASDTAATGTLVSRNGGHCVSFYAARRTAPIEAELEVMDPDHVSPSDDDLSQSRMTPREWLTDDVTFSDSAKPPDVGKASVMQEPTSEGELRVIDEIHVIRPFWILTQIDAGLFQITSPLSSSVSSRSSEQAEFAVPGRIQDVTLRSDQLFGAVVTRDPAGRNTLGLVDLRSAEHSRIARTAAPIRVAFSRFQELYASDGRTIRRYDVESGAAVELGSAMMQSSPRALEWVDEFDELWALDAARGRMVAISRDLAGVQRRIAGDSLFTSLSSDPAVRMTSVPGGAVALLSPEQGVVAVFAISSEDEFSVRAQRNDVGGAGDLSAADNGNIIVTLGDGRVVELADDGHGVLEVHDETPTRGMRSAGVVEAARSRTNFDPRLHTGPGFSNRGER